MTGHCAAVLTCVVLAACSGSASDAGAPAAGQAAGGSTVAGSGTATAGEQASVATGAAGTAGTSAAPGGAGVGAAGARAAAGMPATTAAGAGQAAVAPRPAGTSAGAAESGRGGAGARAAGAGGIPAAQAGSGGAPPAGLSPVYRIPLRVHIAQSGLSASDLGTVFDELERIWLSQAGICFEIEVTSSEDNRKDGFDFRYTSGRIPGASSANGLTQNAHAIWSIDHPQLGAAAHPVSNPTARTTAHELGHALGLAHENPPPSDDCSSPCYCVERKDDCDDYLLRSGTKGFFLSPPEVEITRKRAAGVSLPDHTPSQCGAAMFQP